MSDLKHFEDCGGGSYIARFADGTEYGFRPDADDTMPMHKELVAAFNGKTVPVVPHVRTVDQVRDYFLNRIDEIATVRMKSPNPAQDQAQKAKIEEARDAIDVLSSDGEQALSSLSADDILIRYPLLSASAAAAGQSIADTARLVQAKALRQRQDLSKIEHWRLTAKRDIRAAQTAEQAEVAFQKAANATG